MESPFLLPMVLGIVYGSTELVISWLKRSGPSATRADNGSLRLFQFFLPCGIGLAVYTAIAVPAGRFALSPPLEWTAIALTAAGLALRWYAIIHLGRFFTVDVAIAPDHRLIDSGPYHYVRHPSYTGALLAFIGLGLSLSNVLAFLVLMLSVTITYVYRIRVEEAALRTGIGEPYVAYSARTRRLIPGLF